jgi:hypothetical protein
MTKTLTNLDDATPADLEAEYQRLSYEVSQGNTAAGIKLAKIEDRIEANQRADRRRLAATAEASRLEAEASARAADAERAEKVRERELWLEAKDRAYAQVQDAVDALVAAVKIALDAGAEVRSCNLSLGHPAGRLPANEITAYLAWKLGRNGPDCAGLSDMPPSYPAMRQPLVQE